MTAPAGPPVPALRLRHLGVPFGHAPGLSSISLEVAAGERVAIVGASGVGKTSLLRAIAGLTPVTSGTVEIAGVDVTPRSPERRDAVYLHQSPLLFPHLDVLENVAFPLRVRGVPEDETMRRARRALSDVRLEALERRRPVTLSGGQKHRVALARAVVARPAVLLLDEPLSALDPTLRDEMRRAIVALQEEYGPALLLVTHDLDEAGILGARVGVLLDGGLAQVSPPGELFSRPATLAVARFLGLGNEVRGIGSEDGYFVSPQGRIPLGQPAILGPVVAVFRPEAVTLGDGEWHGRVVEIRHRARGASALIRAGELILEAALSRAAPVSPGDLVAYRIDPGQVCFFPSDSPGDTDR